MAGSIDPRCETIRGTHWPVKVAGVFGTRVAENHLGQRPPTASTGRTYGCKRSDQTMKKLLRHGGRPHMGPGSAEQRQVALHRVHGVETIRLQDYGRTCCRASRPTMMHARM